MSRWPKPIASSCWSETGESNRTIRGLTSSVSVPRLTSLSISLSNSPFLLPLTKSMSLNCSLYVSHYRRKSRPSLGNCSLISVASLGNCSLPFSISSQRAIGTALNSADRRPPWKNSPENPNLMSQKTQNRFSLLVSFWKWLWWFCRTNARRNTEIRREKIIQLV